EGRERLVGDERAGGERVAEGDVAARCLRGGRVRRQPDAEGTGQGEDGGEDRPPYSARPRGGQGGGRHGLPLSRWAAPPRGPRAAPTSRRRAATARACRHCAGATRVCQASQ